jgi:hypothetical protein
MSIASRFLPRPTMQPQIRRPVQGPLRRSPTVSEAFREDVTSLISLISLFALTGWLFLRE